MGNVCPLSTTTNCSRIRYTAHLQTTRAYSWHLTVIIPLSACVWCMLYVVPTNTFTLFCSRICVNFDFIPIFLILTVTSLIFSLRFSTLLFFFFSLHIPFLSRRRNGTAVSLVTCAFLYCMSYVLAYAHFTYITQVQDENYELPFVLLCD